LPEECDGHTDTDNAKVSDLFLHIYIHILLQQSLVRRSVSTETSEYVGTSEHDLSGVVYNLFLKDIGWFTVSELVGL
jgi:hypothetical protein